MIGQKVLILKPHPWAGYHGTIQAFGKPSIGILPSMFRVKLDNGQDCPSDHECYAELNQLKATKG